jgi:hypothetical protein
VKVLSKAILPALIASALSGYAWSQEDCVEIEGTPPGLYATTDEGRTYLVKDGKTIELGPGQAGFADENGVKCITKPPAFLDWPCSTQAAQSRMFNTYTIDELTDKNKIQEIITRYFDVPEVLAPIPDWVDGEYNAVFDYGDLLQYTSSEYWYHPNTKRPFMDPKRPRSLLVSLYVGINKVVIDNYEIDLLRKELQSDQIPVTFVFNDSNVVPISYFGPNVSIEEVSKAFFERGIKLADVPIWWLGDYHLQATIEEYEKFFDIPPLDDISAEKQAAIRAELQGEGFTRKPFIVTIMSDSESMMIDQPERLRVAASMGIKQMPVVFNFIEPDMVLARCGPGTPIGYGSNAISGESTPPGGTTVPPGAPAAPPPVETVNPTRAPVVPPPPDPDVSNS